jgi:hypothetical protein
VAAAFHIVRDRAREPTGCARLADVESLDFTVVGACAAAKRLAALKSGEFARG